MSRNGTRQRGGWQPSSPSRIRSAPSQKGHFSLSGTLEEGTPPVELSSSPPGTATFSRPAWLVPGASLSLLSPSFPLALFPSLPLSLHMLAAQLLLMMLHAAKLSSLGVSCKGACFVMCLVAEADHAMLPA